MVNGVMVKQMPRVVIHGVEQRISPGLSPLCIPVRWLFMPCRSRECQEGSLHRADNVTSKFKTPPTISVPRTQRLPKAYLGNMRNGERENAEQGSTGVGIENGPNGTLSLRSYLSVLPGLLDEQCPFESGKVYAGIWVKLNGMLWRPSDHDLRPVDGSTTGNDFSSDTVAHRRGEMNAKPKDRCWLVEQLYQKLAEYAIAADRLTTKIQSGKDINSEKARINLDSQEILIRSIADAVKALSMDDVSAISKRWGRLKDWRVRLARQDETISDHLEDHEVRNPPTLRSEFSPSSDASRASLPGAPSCQRKRRRDFFSLEHSESKISSQAPSSRTD